MNAEELLPRLEGVRRTSRGFLARCPAHADRSPSLSIAAGNRGVILQCWAGCSLADICAALKIEQRDLFFDTRFDSEAKQQRDTQRREQQRQRNQAGLRLDALREAEATIAAARGIDISKWSDGQLNVALNQLAVAYELVEKEGLGNG